MQINIKYHKQLSQNALKAALQSNKYLKQLLSIKQWEKQTKKPETYALKRDGRIIGKGVGNLKVKYEDLLNFCAFPQFQQMKQYDQMAKEFNVLYESKKLQTGVFRIAYLKYNIPFPFENRDFITVGYREVIKPGEHELFSWKSFQDKDFPEMKGVVRGQTYLIAYEIQKISENQTRLVSISDTDIKGNVPQMVKNLGTKHVSKKIDDIEKYILNKKKK